MLTCGVIKLKKQKQEKQALRENTSVLCSITVHHCFCLETHTRILTNPVDEHPAASVVALREDGMVGCVEEAEHRAGRQTGADLRTLPPPPLVVQ